jgi:translation initiation factor 5A
MPLAYLSTAVLILVAIMFDSLMDDSGDTRDDLKCPEGDVGAEIQAAIADEKDILCTVLSAIGEECVIATKINTAVDK